MSCTLYVTYVFLVIWKKFQIRRTIKVEHKKSWLRLFWDGGVNCKDPNYLYYSQQGVTSFMLRLDLLVKIFDVSYRIYGHIWSIKRTLITKQITDSACKLREKFIKPN
jgi:hypothetical protein